MDQIAMQLALDELGVPVLPCVSCKQPYAYAVMDGVCDGFNKSYGTDYRGEILLHAGMQWDRLFPYETAYRDGMRWRVFEWVNGRPAQVPDCVAQGMIVGVAELLEVATRTSAAAHIPGYHYWRVGNARPFERPVPWRGLRGVFDVPITAVPEVDAQC